MVVLGSWKSCFHRGGVLGQRAALWRRCGTIALTAAGVASAATAGMPVFQAGAARSNITPQLGTSLDGLISQNGPAAHVHDELYARCLVLDDGSSRIAIVIADNTMIADAVFDRAKQFLWEEIGFRPDRVLAAATHSHSTPRAIDFLPGKREREYHNFLAQRIADGVRRAVNNLEPAKIGWGAGQKPELLFNRRWFVTPEARSVDPFGEKTDAVRMNPRDGRETLIKPAGPVDPEIFVLSVQHADGRPLALLANYGLHYVGGTGPGTISADYFGAFADKMAVLLDADRQDPPFVAMMSNGASGDVNGIDSTKPRQSSPPYEEIKRVATEIAREVHQVYQGIEHRAWVPLVMAESQLAISVRRPGPERLQWADGVWNESDRQFPLTRTEIYAREALQLAQFPPVVSLRLQALRIGGLAIAAAPCEVFAATGLQIKERSPLPDTFIISLANGYHGYLPTPPDFQYGGYETWNARSSYLEVDASEKIRDELLRLLNTVSHQAPSPTEPGGGH